MIAATLFPMNTATFGAWLRQARRSHRPPVSQERLAEITGIDRAHLSRMENDKVGLPLYETRQRIHQALGTSDDELRAFGVALRIDHTAAPARQAPLDAFAADDPENVRELIALLRTVRLTGERAALLHGILTSMAGLDRSGMDDTAPHKRSGVA